MTTSTPNRMYSKCELALLYFPDAPDKTSARKHLMDWVRNCTPLWGELQHLGYQKNCQYLPPRQVALIFEYLGEPC